MKPHKLMVIIGERNQKRKSTIITSNLMLTDGNWRLGLQPIVV